MRNRDNIGSQDSNDDFSSRGSFSSFSTHHESFDDSLTEEALMNLSSPPLTQVTFGSNHTCVTDSTISSLETLDDMIEDSEDSSPPTMKPNFQVGDHVYTWCSLLNVPRAYQHHGIVVHVSHKTVKIVDFYPLFDEKQEHTNNKSSYNGSFQSASHEKGRDFTMSTVILDHYTASKEWKIVQYSVPWTERFLRRSGTCSTVQADPVGFVLARIEFLQDNPHVIPPYDQLLSNCECVAVWCKTGMYSSLQGSALLGAAAKGSLTATASAGLGVTATSVTVPCAGVWGWLGYTTTVPLVTAAPLLLPAIVAGGVASTIPPLVKMHKHKQEAKTISDNLNACLAQACRQGLYLPHSPRE